MEQLRLEDLARGRAQDAVTLGNFDGVHRGHQRLVQRVVSEARKGSGRVVVATFEPHPARVLDPSRAPVALMTLAQKAEALEALGVSRLVVLPFDAELARIDADDFARGILRERVGARLIVVGRGFRFGRGRRGDAASLRQASLEVVEVEPLMEDGEPVSSTRIRTAVAAGEVALAQRLLGRPFAHDGSVVAGNGRGRGLGIPTANLVPENEARPADGVYAARCRLFEDGRWGPRVAAVTNVGRQPTFGGVERRIEAHLLEFEGDLYGRRLRIEYHARLREPHRFENAVALVGQVREDVARARRLLENG
jgi:riboflavin kinase/FMN adenylyltransferase